MGTWMGMGRVGGYAVDLQGHGSHSRCLERGSVEAVASRLAGGGGLWVAMAGRRDRVLILKWSATWR